MLFDPKFLTALLFVILSFATIFAVRTHTNTVTTLIIDHLVLILFLGLTITNYNSFKEVVLTLIAYLMAVLFLITNYNNSQNIAVDASKIKLLSRKMILPFVIAAISFLLIFSLTKITYKNLAQQRNSIIAQQNSDNMAPIFDVETLKKNRMKKKLSENFLLKRSSDVILLIVAVSSAILLLRTNQRNV